MLLLVQKEGGGQGRKIEGGEGGGDLFSGRLVVGREGETSQRPERACIRVLSADGSPGNPQLCLGSFCM